MSPNTLAWIFLTVGYVIAPIQLCGALVVLMYLRHREHKRTMRRIAALGAVR